MTQSKEGGGGLCDKINSCRGGGAMGLNFMGCCGFIIIIIIIIMPRDGTQIRRLRRTSGQFELDGVHFVVC